mmetsp:Transcript_663/g.980  ORF Transcript_663/g.980 Transcript_663/m.980 type:complete len:129 (+) Transcript_663:522-908(+)
MYIRETIRFRLLGFNLVNVFPPTAKPIKIPKDKKTASPPARFSDNVPNEVSLKYVPRIRSDDRTMDPPVWAIATIQNVPDFKTLRIAGNTFVMNTDLTTEVNRIARRNQEDSIRTGAMRDGLIGFCGS